MVIILMLGLRYWYVIAGVILLWYISNKLSEFFNREKSPKEFNGKTGKVYKQCEFCGTKAERTAIKCPNCGQSFE